MTQQGTLQPSVLLLSGRPAFLDPLSQAFSAAGLVVLVARDASSAVAAFQRTSGAPAGVILDLLTIDDDAAAVTDALREEPAAASVPVLFIGTGAESIRSTTDALIAGGDGFFQVPVEAGRVVAKIAAYVGTPSPILPHGLLVTIDEHDLLERTPEPIRIVLPPAMLPGDLLGDDDEFLRPEILHRHRHEGDDRNAITIAVRAGAHERLDNSDEEAGDDDDYRSGFDTRDLETPPSGIGRRTIAVERDDDVADDRTFSDDFSDTTSPMLRRPGPHAVEFARANVVTAEAFAIPDQIDDSHDDDDDQQDDAELGAVSGEALAAAIAAAAVGKQALADDGNASDDDAQRRRIADAEAELQAVHDRSRRSGIAVDVAREEQRLRREVEEQRLRELDDARAAAEADLATATSFSTARLQEEERRLHELVAARAAAETAAEKIAAEQAARIEQEEALVAALAAERLAAEEALVAADIAQRERLQRERDRLEALFERRQAIEAQHATLLADAGRRADEDSAEFHSLKERQQQVQAELAAVEATRALRIEEESQLVAALSQRRATMSDDEQQAAEARTNRRRNEEEQLAALLAQRELLAAELAAATEIAAARLADEEARAAQLAAQAEQARHDAQRLQAEHTQQVRDEEARLASLTRERAAAEHAVTAARDGQARRLAQEEARLAHLRADVAAREAEIATLDDEERQHRDAEQHQLALLAAERTSLEAQLAALSSSDGDEEHRARARLAELEVTTLRAQHDVEQLASTLVQEQQRRAFETAAALEALQREQQRAELETEALRVRLAASVADEEAKLAGLHQQRLEREQAARAAHDAQQAALQAQQEQLRELNVRAELERARLADEAAAVEATLQQETNQLRERLDRLHAEQQSLVDAAGREADRLAHLRAEEEVARAALVDARARARLAFVSGRFDAMPEGAVALATDVGGAPRVQGDGEGIPHGGPLVDVGADGIGPAWAHEPPPPLPFVALEPPLGRFSDGELPGLLLSAWTQRVTGSITIVSDDRRRDLFLEEGEPVLVTSSLAVDRPEEALLAAGLITAAVHSELRAGELLSARRLCARLIDDGALKLEELFSAVRGVVTEQLLHLLEWQTGTFSFSEARAHAVDRVRLEHRFDAVVAEGVRRKYDEARLWSVLGGPATLLGVADSAALLPPLSAEERLVIERLDGTRSLDDVVLGCGLHAHVVLRAAVLAVACGAVKVLARGLPKGPDDAVARREHSVSIDRHRVIDRLALARHGDYFTFLGVESTATPFEVHRAAMKLRERFEPSRYTDIAFADLRPALREIVDVINDAEAVLADPGLREAYRINLRAPQPSSSSSSRSRVG